MQKKTFLCLTVVVVVAISSHRCLAHGGGGGGGHVGGGGGGHVGGYSGGAGHESHYSHPAESHSERSYHGEGEHSYEHRDNFNHEQHLNEWNHENVYNHSNNINNLNINGGRYPAGNHYPYANHYGPHPNYGNWYHGYWGPGWYHHPVAWWGAGFVAGAIVAEAPWNWGYWSYSNPYYETSAAGVVVVDYSEPLVPNETAGAENAAKTDSTDRAMEIFASARKAFSTQDYPVALKQIENSLALLPRDAVMNEFRCQTLFAMKRYKDAAGAAYAVLSVGPGWDWTTLSSLYPNVDVYTAQLRALEDFVRSNKEDSAARFLLAFQYLSSGSNEAAVAQLKRVVALNPQDALSPQLLKSLTDNDPTQPPTAPKPRADAAPVVATDLTGDWKSARPDGSSISLSIAPNGNFTWKFTRKDKTQEFTGPYTVADNLLILKQNGNPVMVGQVTLTNAEQFNFKLPGDNPNDPGLTFTK